MSSTNDPNDVGGGLRRDRVAPLVLRPYQRESNGFTDGHYRVRLVRGAGMIGLECSFDGPQRTPCRTGWVPLDYAFYKNTFDYDRPEHALPATGRLWVGAPRRVMVAEIWDRVQHRATFQSWLDVDYKLETPFTNIQRMTVTGKAGPLQGRELVVADGDGQLPPPADFSGTWRTTSGAITLVQNGDLLSGTIDARTVGGGTAPPVAVEGGVFGEVAVVHWGSGAAKRRLFLRLAPEGTSIEGCGDGVDRVRAERPAANP
jgi:hypothetical protein